MKVYALDNIYVKGEKKLFIYDEEFKLLKHIDVNNIYPYNGGFVEIEANIARIYKNNTLYHNLILPLNVDNFVSNEFFIFSFDKNILTIISLIGNKVVFKGAVAKSDIKKIILKDTKLFIQSQNSITVLDILKKKVVFSIKIQTDLFDTDGEMMVGFKDGSVFLIDFEKNIKEFQTLKNITYLKNANDTVFIKEGKNLYFISEDEEKLITQKACGFDIKGEYLYVMEDELKKYKISGVTSSDTIKFLTVDDSSTMRIIIKNAILNNFENVEVYEAKDGKKALEVLEKNPDINIVFMDWNMPVMNGRDAVIKIRENEKFNHVKIIMATTEGGSDKVKEMINYGVKGYLVKPLKPSSVVPVAEKMIELVKEERNV